MGELLQESSGPHGPLSPRPGRDRTKPIPIATVEDYGGRLRVRIEAARSADVVAGTDVNGWREVYRLYCEARSVSPLPDREESAWWRRRGLIFRSRRQLDAALRGPGRRTGS